jgi:hypothetical protein
MEKKIYKTPAIHIVHHNVILLTADSYHNTVGDRNQLSRGQSFRNHDWVEEDEEDW